MLRLFTIFLSLIISLPAFAQFTDDFSDANFTANPAWGGDTGEFTVESQTLRSNGPSASSTLHLSTPNTQLNATEWRFWMDLQFAPSASNQVRVYLVADQANLEGNLNGYYLEIGQTGGDVIKFFRQNGATRTELFAGNTTFTGNVTVRIRVLRDNAGQWQIFADTDGGSNFVSQGNAFTDNTLTNTSFFGVVCTHTSTRNTLFFFDDFFVGNQVVDNTPPTLTSTQVISATQLDVRFSESLNAVSAQNTTNYTANNGLGNPSQASIDAQDAALVHLTFANAFGDGLENTLTVQNVTDLSANTLSPNPSTSNFTYFAPVTADFRDIVINELMADPTPTQGLPEAEFIELYNPGTQAISLQNWTLGGAVLPNYTLAPDSYVIFCDQGDEGSFSSFGDVFGLSDWNTLTNGGEEILLNDNTAQLIDRVDYALTWYQDNQKDNGGFTLEQINPALACSGMDNWSASNAAVGGTPGAQNSIFDLTPDQTAPGLLSASIQNPTTILLQFTESMDESSLGVLSNYALDNGIAINAVQSEAPEFRTVQLTLSPALVEGTTYTLALSNLTDCSGNALLQTTTSLALGSVPTFHELVISELMADPTGNAQPVNPLPETEYIELFNRSNRVLDLKDCRLEDESGGITLPQQALLPGEYITLVDNAFAADFQAFGKVLGLATLPDLLNSGEQLVLNDPEGALIFTITYDNSWYQNNSKADGGFSLEMIDTDNPCGEASNWLASEAERGGTPGQVNSVNAIRPDLTAPRLIRAEALDAQTVRLLFNEKMDAVSLQNGQYQLSAGLGVSTVQPENPAFKRVLLTLANPMAAQTRYSVTVDNIQDCAGNLIGEVNTTEFGLPEAPDSLDIVLNEILFNPFTGGSDFLELYNNSQKFINLKNWIIANIDDGIPANQKFITEEDYIMAPETYVVLSNNVGNIKNNYPMAQEDTFLELASLPSYPDDEGTVILISDQNQLVERFDYQEEFHFPLLDDEEGVSLERIAFALPTNNPNSWQSAASTAGFATPGFQNSQRARENTRTARINITPQVFTPDGDGLEDFTTINLNLNQGGVLVDISIFDSRGRLTKRLAQRAFVGTDTGTFTWDGTDDRNNLARMGYYLALIKVFNTNGNVETFKEKLVVGRRF